MKPSFTNAVFVEGEWLKRCPRCTEELQLSEFGVCQARPDRMNLYCKRCIRQKIALGRAAVRAMKRAQRAAGTLPPLVAPAPSARRVARMLRKLSPADRVREAIKRGAHTQEEITALTKLPKDEVCDALANLLLWTREIFTQRVGHQRRYFIREKEKAVTAPVRKEMAMSFSVVKALMPERVKMPDSKLRTSKRRAA